MSEIKIEVKNYKKLKQAEYDLSNGTIFIMSGPNNQGKTSFLNLLRSIMEVKDDTVNPVTFGEKEGHAVGKIIGADNLEYQFRYDFNVDGKSKFIFIGPDGKQVSGVGKMREIFNYTHFTLEEFFDWSKTESGRKKQRDIIMKLLNEKEQEEMSAIDAKINTKDGTLYIKRRDENKALEALETISKVSVLTEEQKKILKQAKIIRTSLDKLNERKAEIDALIVVDPEVVEKIATCKGKVTTANTNITNANEEIKRLEALIEAQKAIIKTEEEVVTLNTNEIEALSPKSDGAVDVTALTLELNGDGTEENPGIVNRITKGNAVLNALTVAEALYKSIEENKEKIDLKQKEIDSINEQLDTLRDRKKAIITSCANIPDNITVEEDYITVDGIPFTENDLSKSAGTKAIARLMMIVNKAPIMLMGDAEALGFEILDVLKEEAEAAGKVMVFAEHVRYKDEIELVCYDELDKEGAIKDAASAKPKSNTNELF